MREISFDRGSTFYEVADDIARSSLELKQNIIDSNNLENDTSKVGMHDIYYEAIANSNNNNTWYLTDDGGCYVCGRNYYSSSLTNVNTFTKIGG